MKRVLLTGGSGYIGSKTIPYLLEQGYEVHLLLRNTSTLTRSCLAKNCYAHEADIFEKEQVTALLNEVRPTHLLHLAWYAEHGKFWHADVNADWLLASLQLLQSFERHNGKRALFAGTCAEYDWSFGYCVENITPCAPQTFYGHCKNQLQQTAQILTQHSALSFAWGRIFFLYGEDEHPNRLVSSVISKLLRGEPPQCSHGQQIRDFMHVTDVARALVELLDSNVAGPVNVSSGQPYSIGEIVRRLGQQFGAVDRINFGALPTPPNEPPLIVGNPKRLREEVGFKANYGLEAGLKKAVEWWVKPDNKSKKWP